MTESPIDRLAGAVAVALIGSIAALAAGCAERERPDREPERLRLAVSLPPLATVVERIAGEDAEVFSLLGPGDSPATYQLPDAQVTRVARATIYFRVGVPFEDGPGLAALASVPSLHVVDLRRGITLRPMSAAHAGEHGGRPDPHLWLDPAALVTVAETVRSALCEHDPDACDGYGARHAELVEELEALDAELAALLEPRRGAELFVFHPSWGYFADAYGLRQVAIESEGKMPSEAELGELAARMRSSGASVLFVQPQIGGSAAAAAAAALDVELEALDPLAPDVLANLRHVAERIARGAG